MARAKMTGVHMAGSHMAGASMAKAHMAGAHFFERIVYVQASPTWPGLTW